MSTLEFLHQNVCADRYDYNKTWSKRRPAFLATVKRFGPDALSLTECQAPAAGVIANELAWFGRASFWGSSLLWRTDVLNFRRRLVQLRWLNGTQTHSLLICEFKHLPTGRLINLGTSHLPPNATRALARRRDMATVASRTAGWHDPSVIGTDANWRSTFEAYMAGKGWTSARTAAATRVHADYRTSAGKFAKGAPIDYVIGRKAAFARYEVIDGRKYSDHNGLLVEVKL